MAEHFKRTKKNREGYFQKDEKGMPNKGYRRICKKNKRGYVGGKHEAHHILPATSFNKAIEAVRKTDSDKATYIENCQHITPWNINNKNNLMGLPNLLAYVIYYQDRARPTMTGELARLAKSIKSFNADGRLTSATRNRYLKLIRSGKSPEGHPIHLPTSWGHVEYNKEVAKEIKKYIWDKLSENKKWHKVDPVTVEATIIELENENYSFLLERGEGANEENWKDRDDEADSDWYVPFTMYDVSNPLG
jgi:hypothetical protein